MSDLKPISIPRAYQLVHEALEAEIMSGRLAPGQPLPTEAELAQKFGVARHTVREGMRVLEQGGLVKRDAGRRLHVTLPRYDELASRTSRALTMQRVTFRELWEVSMPLEVCAVELAVRYVDDDLVWRLESNLAAMEIADTRGQSIIKLDIEFHSLIAEASRNRALLLSREPVSLLFYPTLQRLFSHPKTSHLSPVRLIEAHREIIAAFRARDAGQAQLWMSRHMADFRRGYEHAGIDLDEVADAQA